MDRLHAMKVFVAVADAQSFAQAGRQLGMSPPAVTRAVAALETEIGTLLLVRTTRSVRLTEAGRRYHADCSRILSDLAEADEAAAGLHGAPRGLLNVTASALFGRMYVAPILRAFCDLYPGVTANALFVDRVVHMQDEGFDVAIRIAELSDSSATAIRVGSVRRAVYAAPAYLERFGEPRHPHELAHHRVAAAQAPVETVEWVFAEDGRELRVGLSPRLFVNAPDALIDTALSGWAIARSLSYQIAPHVETGALRRILHRFEPAPVPVHIVFQEGRKASAKVRAFVDFAAAQLKANPSIGAPS